VNRFFCLSVLVGFAVLWSVTGFAQTSDVDMVVPNASCMSAKKAMLFFTSQGKTCLINADGTGFKVLEMSVPNQMTWQPTGFLSDGRVLMLSMEPRRDGPGRPFEEYYHQTPTHVWAYSLDSGELTELAVKERLAPFYTPQLLLNDGRILMQVVRTKGSRINKCSKMLNIVSGILYNVAWTKRWSPQFDRNIICYLQV